MTRITMRFLLTAVATVCILSTSLFGAKPVKSQPATVTFRCSAADGLCPAGAVVSDGIRGDGQAYSAILDANGELFLSLTHGGGRTLWLDFRNGPGPSCPTCRRDFDTLFLDDLVFHTNVSDASGIPVTGGLKSVPVGGWSYSRLKVAFNRLNSAGQGIGWAVRYNPVDYPGSDLITVRRPSTTTWEIEAYASDRAVLASGSQRSPQNEGPFYMPFKVTMVSPAP